MSNLRIANRYAEALMKASEELKKMTEVGNDLRVIRKLINDSREFRLFLKSPVIKKGKKQQVFEATFGKTVQQVTLQFLILLSEKEREDVLPNIIDAFFKLQDIKMGFVTVEIKTAKELSKEQSDQLKNRFEEFSGKKVKLDVEMEKELIGGLIARIGDTMFDGSVKRQLQLLRKKFNEELTVV